MNIHVKALSDQLQLTSSLNVGRMQPNMSSAEVIAKFRQSTSHIKKLVLESSALFEEYIFQLLEKSDLLTDEDEIALHELAQKISSYEIRFDTGLGLKIYQALLRCARANQDRDKIIKYLYWCGITMFFHSESLLKDALELFLEAGSYRLVYFEIKNPETRKYIHRCLGNCGMIYHSIKENEKAIEHEEMTFQFWNEVIFSGQDGDIPWDAYFMSVFNHRHSYFTRTLHTDPKLCTKSELKQILDSAITINKLYQKKIGQWSTFGGTRYEFSLWEAQYMNNLISFKQLQENIDKRKALYKKDDFSADAIYVNVMLYTYLMFYAQKTMPNSKETPRLLHRITNEVHEYLASIPMSVNPVLVGNNFQMFAANTKNLLDPKEHFNLVLKMTTYRHIPTFAHSIMVSKIATFLAYELIKTKPDSFIGICGIATLQDVLEKKEEIITLIKRAAIAHDIGKIRFINNIANFSRILTEEDMVIIQSHPSNGKALLAHNSEDLMFEGIAEIVEGHHRFYDGIGGYPKSFDIKGSPYQVLIHIISIADSIDAATDDIGKSYASAITFEQVREEIRAQSGTRYSPMIAKLLDGETISKGIISLLQNERERAYYDAYLYAWGNDIQLDKSMSL